MPWTTFVLAITFVALGRLRAPGAIDRIVPLLDRPDNDHHEIMRLSRAGAGSHCGCGVARPLLFERRGNEWVFLCVVATWVS